MSHENMYVAEKTLCAGRLIELEKLNDVRGIGRQRQREKHKAPAPTATVFECRGGVMARVSVQSRGVGAGDSSEPFVADGGELLEGLSAQQRSAVLHGELLPDAGPPSYQVTEPGGSQVQSTRGRAAAPSWVRRRKGGKQPRLQQPLQAFAAAEAETDDDEREKDEAPPWLVPSQKRHRRGTSEERKAKEDPRSSQHRLSFEIDEGIDEAEGMHVSDACYS